MFQKVSVVEPESTFQFFDPQENSNAQTSEASEKENFYNALNAFNLTLFWAVIMLSSYIVAFSIAILVIIADQREHFLVQHSVQK